MLCCCSKQLLVGRLPLSVLSLNLTTCSFLGFAEKLFVKLRSAKTERFEIRLMYMNLISRLIGVHDVRAVVMFVSLSFLRCACKQECDILLPVFWRAAPVDNTAMQLFVLNFYPYLQRYLQPYQKGKPSSPLPLAHTPPSSP